MSEKNKKNVKAPITRSRVAKKKQKKNTQKKKFFFLSIPGIILIIILLGVTYLGVDQVIQPIMKSKQPLSILLVGSDMNAYREETKEGTKPEKTDSLMVVTFNPSDFRFVTTSIPRDTAVDYACMDMRGKINEIYPASGNDIGCLEESVENFLNIPIDYYVKVNMDQIEEIIDSVGTLTITAHAADGYLSQENVEGTATYEWGNGETYEMNSDEALTYARARHDSEKDYGRGKRQQQVIMAVVKDLLEQGLSIETIKDLLSMVDTNMQPLLLKEYYDYAKTLQTVFNKVENGEKISQDDLPSGTWSNAYNYFEYSGNKNADDFQTYLIENYSIDEIKGYFFESNQFYNDSYNGYYVTPDDQRYEISNKLRDNLGLSEETPTEQTKSFGVNDFGCEVSASNDCGLNSSSSPGGYSYTPSDYYEDTSSSEESNEDTTSDVSSVNDSTSTDQQSTDDDTQNTEDTTNDDNTDSTTDNNETTDNNTENTTNTDEITDNNIDNTTDTGETTDNTTDNDDNTNSEI